MPSPPASSDELTGPGAPFEIVDEVVLGEVMPVFKNRARSARELLLESAQWGDSDYIVQGAERITFREHLDRVAALAHVLREDYGVGRGDRIAILAANCPEWIVTFWATVSLGAIAASMNAWWADPELADALTRCEPTVVVADRARLEQVRSASGSEVPCIEIESEFASLVDRGRGASLPDEPIAEDDPAVILYTSGTTGRSKGAVATHRSICGAVSVSRHSGAAAAAALAASGERPQAAAGTGQATLVTVPLFHASGLYGFIVLQLATGGKLVLRPGRFDPDDVLRLIEEERITMWAALGSMGPRVAERAAASPRDLSSLRVLGVGGAPVSPAQQDLLRAAFPHTSINVSMGYSSSEAVAVVTRIQGEEMRMHPTSAGRPLATTALEIRDPDGGRVPDGVDGEVHVRSPYLMIGYWRDDDATRTVLKPGRWLAMGDIGSLRDGRLYINSRARDMILVNAENVFPTEVEYRLDEHPGVRECAVLGVADDLTGQAVRAVVVVDGGSSLCEDDLRAWCRAAMARYKVPTQWEIRDAPLPRNPSGKVLKRELDADQDGVLARKPCVSTNVPVSSDRANPGARGRGRLLAVFVAGAVVAVGIGAYGREHDPTFERPFSLGFTDTINFKVWFATLAAALAVVQILLALRIYGRISWPRTTPTWLGDLHRLLGTLAFVATLPVAFLCLWSLGFQDGTTRVLVHSLLGCSLYGAFVVKVLGVRLHGLPGWLLPVAGGAVFAALIGIWLTSSFWFFRHVGFPEF